VEDYLLNFPDIAWPGGPLQDAPLEFKVRKVDEHVANVLREGHQCLAIRAELAATVLALATVDYIAGFRCGRRSKGRDYVECLEELFPPVYHEHAGWIYEHLRCGLMHNLTALNPWRQEQTRFRITSDGLVHLGEADGAFVFQVHVFLIDVYRAWVMYQHHLVMKADRSGEAVRKFCARFDRLGGLASSMEKQ
jgi:hypothetical protein